MQIKLDKLPQSGAQIEQKKVQALSWARKFKQYSGKKMRELRRQPAGRGDGLVSFSRSYRVSVEEGDFMAHLIAYADSNKLWCIETFSRLDSNAFEPVGVFEKTRRTQNKWEETVAGIPEEPPGPEEPHYDKRLL